MIEKKLVAAGTEQSELRFADIDRWPTGKAVTAMLAEQASAVALLSHARDAITAAIDAAAARLEQADGRLIYAGAGASGRLAVQDGVELRPTYSWPDERLLYLVAGGEPALVRSIEGAEDDADAALQLVKTHSVNAADVVIGVAASGRTPFTLAVIETARGKGALTIGIANNPGTPLLSAAEFPILADTGSELIAGSTRMKAGTAQKVILNTISTGIMLRLGKVYRGLMVDMVISNAKLRGRAQGIVQTITGCDEATAIRALAASDDNIKQAVLIAMGHPFDGAAALLAAHGDNLGESIAVAGKGDAG